MASSGRKLEAVKLYREIFGVGLEEANVAVDRMAQGQTPPQMTVMTPGSPAHLTHQVAHAARRSTAAWVVLSIVVIVFIGLAIGITSFVSRFGASKTGGESSSTSPGTSERTTTTAAAPGFASVALKFGGEGIGPGMFKDARSVALDGEGRIYVGEYLNSGRIQVFDAGGKFITQWAVDPKMPLRDLTADRKGTVYVVQRGEINRFEGASGNPLGKLEYGGSQRAYFDDARTTADGGLIGVINNEDIVRFNANGQVVRTINKAISTQTGDPESIDNMAVDGLGNIYALSGGHDIAVFKFSPEGRFINRFGSSGEQPGQFRAAYAIAVDGQGRIYVSDIKGIQVFGPDGRYLDVFKVEGHVAVGLVFNDKNELFVAARTQVIKYVLNK